MEYTLSSYRRLFGKVYTTSDGHKFINSKISEKCIYLRCAIFRPGCKGTGRLNRVTDFITPLLPHNHNTVEYRLDVFDLKTKCNKTAMHSETNLRHVFDDTTRGDPSARELTFPNANRQFIVPGEGYNRIFPQMLLNFAKCYLLLV